MAYIYIYRIGDILTVTPELNKFAMTADLQTLTCYSYLQDEYFKYAGFFMLVIVNDNLNLIPGFVLFLMHEEIPNLLWLPNGISL